MRRELIGPMPGWLAAKLRYCGERVVLAVMGYGLLESNGPQEDQRIANDYADMAAMIDLTGYLYSYYTDLGEAHPWAEPHLGTLKGLLYSPNSSTETAVYVACQLMSTVSINLAERLAEFDLLGRVQAELLARSRKQTTSGYNVDLKTAEMSAILEFAKGSLPLLSLRDTTDMWAGSGMRMLGLAAAMLFVGMDPREHQWKLMDADPLNRTVIALNAIAFDLLGEQVTIADGSEFQQASLAAYSLNGVNFSDVWQVNPARIDGSRT